MEIMSVDPREDPGLYAHQLKEQGNEAFRNQQYGAALTHYSCALEVDPENPVLHLNRALCHGALGQWVHSKIDAQEAMQLSNDYYPKAHCRYILALLELKEYKLARQELQLAKTQGDNPDVKRLETLLFKRANITLAPNASDFDVVSELGEGNFSKVYKAKHKYNNRIYAIKEIEKAQVHQLRRRHKNIDNEIMMEKTVLAKLKHPNIVTLYGTFHDVGSLYYLTEFCDGGELWEQLKLPDGSKCGLPPSIVGYYAAELLNALEYMHQHGVVHRDVKPENILLSSSGHLKVIDFGTAKDMIDTRLNGQEFVGTAEYMSPEVIKAKHSGPETDLWAFGCVVFQLLSGRSPFNTGSPYLSFLKIRRGYVQYPAIISEDAIQVIEKLLIHDRSQRLFNATGQMRDAELDAAPPATDNSANENENENDAVNGNAPKADESKASATSTFDASVYCYDTLRQLPFFQSVKRTTLGCMSYALQEPLGDLSLTELHRYPALRVPTLAELAIRATAAACSKVAEALWRADAEAVAPPEWVSKFDVKRLGVTSAAFTSVQHILRCQDKLHEPRIFRQFFNKMVEARALRADLHTHEYIGLEYRTNHQWKEPFFFVQIADPQLGIIQGLAEKDGRGGSSWEVEKENLRQAISAINKLRPKFVIVSGDLTHAFPNQEFYQPQVRDFRKLMARISETIPVLYVCGNHDAADDMTPDTLQTYTNNFGADYYGFWASGLRGLVLNSCLWKSDACPEQAQEQMRWFEQEIEQAKLCAEHVMIFTHHPWFLNDLEEEDNGAGSYWTVPRAIRLKLMQLLHHRKVSFVFSGHYHRNLVKLAFPNAGDNANDSQQSQQDAEKEEEDDKEDEDNKSDKSSDNMEDNENEINEHKDFTGPEMVTTNSLAYSLDGTPPGFRIVEVHQMSAKQYYVELDNIPTKIALEP